jgi:protease-4
MSKFYDTIKTLFIVLIALQITPSLLKGIKTQYKYLWQDKTKVGKMTIKGGIEISEDYIEQLKKLYDKDIKALLINVESPGGAAGSSYAIFNEIKELKKEHPEIPVVALTENICASGGYYVACACDHIIASRASLVGSIGVYMGHLQIKDFIEKNDIYYDIIKSGKYKAATSPFTKLTEADKSNLKRFQKIFMSNLQKMYLINDLILHQIFMILLKDKYLPEIRH